MANILAKALMIVGAALLLSSCTALQNVENASKSLDVFELRPLTFDPPRPGRGTRSLLVEPPTASGTFATDRIVVKPSELEVKYLADARWNEDAPSHVQRLLATSLTNSGRFGHVALNDGSITPDFVLISNLDAFHAAISSSEAGAVTVSIRVALTLIRDEDRTLLGTQIVAAQATAASDDASALVPAFDQAMQAVLRDALDWVIAKTR